jgi:hypothetical protein
MTAGSPTRPFFVVLLGLAVARCGGASDDGSTGASGEAIVGGAAADAPDSPVLYLSGPEGGCTAVLVAPNLVITARHCVASSTTGPFTCTPGGDLVGSGAGSIGASDAPGSIGLFSSARIMAGVLLSGGSPDAVGVQIVSTNTPTACRDDLALVVLDRAVAGVVPVPIRIDGATRVGETVSVWGYGLTDRLEPTALRVRSGVPITGVGPDTPPTTTQPAPVRSLRTGPVTCQGDSGGPMIAETTGAVIAVVSLGSQAGTSGPYCASDQFVDTIGPRLAAYHDLILSAFQAAGASPIPEVSMTDAASDSAPTSDGPSPVDSTGESDSATEPESASVSDAPVEPDSASTPEPAPTGVLPPSPIVYRATGASCGIGSQRRDPPGRLGAFVIALAWTAAAVGRRRRS